MGARCCVNCFGHKWLRHYVRDNREAMDDCDYCGHKSFDVVVLGALYDPFHNLMELYVPSDAPYGEMLIDLIQSDHEVFGEDLYTSDKAARLLEDIMRTGWDDDSGEAPVDAHELYYRRSSLWYHTTMAEAWEEFCDQVKENPEHEPDLPELLHDDLARMEVELTKGTILYRTRVGFRSKEGGEIKPFEDADIGPPPPGKAKPGRANAEGEVVLYVADQEATAIAESRPWRGLLVSVAEITVALDLHLVDLSKPPPSLNPFTDETPQYELEFAELLMAFGEELGRPLRRADDPRDYLPCQKLVRRMRESGLYDGIRYPSAMVPGGTNVVLFDPKVAPIGPSKIVEVLAVGISYEPFE